MRERVYEREGGEIYRERERERRRQRRPSSPTLELLQRDSSTAERESKRFDWLALMDSLTTPPLPQLRDREGGSRC
jgi:hypothetical protein